MTITALPTAPARTDDPATYITRADAMMAAFPTMVTEMNAVAVAMSLNSINDTSTTSNTIGLGALTFTVSASKSFQPGMYLVIADTAAPSTNSIVAQVTSYSSTTLVVNSLKITGSGTKTAWTISMSGAPNIATALGSHEVLVTSGNGHGSTNTKIRRYTTTQTNTGTAITYADSATNGASFTINETGLYGIYMNDSCTGSVTRHGASLNSAQLTTGIDSITAANRLFVHSNPAAGTSVMAASRVVYLTAADVVRPHTMGLNDGANTYDSAFGIRKIGVIT